jgi:hypothetical protein
VVYKIEENANVFGKPIRRYGPPRGYFFGASPSIVISSSYREGVEGLDTTINELLTYRHEKLFDAFYSDFLQELYLDVFPHPRIL